LHFLSQTPDVVDLDFYLEMESLPTSCETTMSENTIEVPGKQVPSPGASAPLTSAALSEENQVKLPSDSSLATNRLFQALISTPLCTTTLQQPSDFT
jgi:hypothetical protein